MEILKDIGQWISENKEVLAIAPFILIPGLIWMLTNIKFPKPGSGVGRALIKSKRPDKRD